MGVRGEEERCIGRWDGSRGEEDNSTHACAHTHAHTHARAHTHAHMHTHVRTHAHTHNVCLHAHSPSHHHYIKSVA